MAVVVVVAAVVTAVMTVLIYMSKDANTGEGCLVEAVVALGAAVHYGLNLHKIDE